MKIALTLDYCLLGFGKCEVVARWVTELHERGHETALFIGEGDRSMVDHPNCHVMYPLTTDIPGQRRGGEHRIHRQCPAEFVSWMGERLGGFEPDVVVTSDSADAWATMASHPHLPIITTLRTDLRDWQLRDRDMMEWICSIADHALVWNPDVLEWMQQRHLSAERSSWACSGALLIEHSQPLDGGHPQLSFCGRLDANKGADRLIRALPYIRQRHPDASLSILGDGPDRHMLEQLAHDEDVADAVYFLGYRTDAPEFVASSDMFCLPSGGEGFSRSLCEAMLTGVTVAADGRSAQPLQDGAFGRIFEHGSDEALAYELLAELASPQRDRRRQAGQAYAHAHYSRAAALTALEEVIAHVTTQPQRTGATIIQRTALKNLADNV